MRYLVTGAQGFTGRFLCAEILGADPAARVVGTGRSAAAGRTFTHTVSWNAAAVPAPLTAELRALDRERYTYERCDLADAAALDELLGRYAPDCVVHLAAALRDDPAEVLIRSNAAGTAGLVAALAKMPRAPRLVLGSSGSVYGPPLAVPLTEDQRCEPNEPYAMSKLAAELVARVLTSAAGIPLMIARIFNIAGPGQEERHVCGRFAAQAAAIVRGYASPLLTIGDLLPTRDFIDVRDVARALVCLAANGVSGEVYNVGSGVETAIGQVLDLTLRTARLEGSVTLETRYARPADVPRAFADIGKLRACGFTPRYSLEATVSDLLSYYLTDVAKAAGADPTTSAANASISATPSSHG